MRARRATALVVLMAATLAGCAKGSTHIIGQPLCRAGDNSAGDGVILMAQSVPTATRIPCIRTALPLGWGFNHLEAEAGGSTFSLDSDRDGLEAITVRLTRACDVNGTTEIPTDREGLVRRERVTSLSPHYSGQRFYLFSGGCLTFTFRLAGDSPGEGLAVATQSIGVVSRTDLQAQVRKESHGRLSLDPPPGGQG